AEHFIGLSPDGVTPDTSSLSEEQHGALLLRDTHRPPFAPRKTVDRRVGEDQRELELGDGPPEHREVDGAACCHCGEQLTEQSAIGRRRIEPGEYSLANGLVSKPGPIRGWNDRARAVVKLVEFGADRTRRPGKAGDFHEL